MTYCNKSDVFILNGAVVRCTEVNGQSVKLVELETGVMHLCEMNSKIFQIEARPILHTLKYAGVGKFELSLWEIANVVEKYTGISPQQQKNKNRKEEIVFARHLVMAVACMVTSLKLSTIGAYFNGQDHTTVIHGRDKIKDYCDTKDNVRFMFEAIIHECRFRIESTGIIDVTAPCVT